jgi:hypothetical protein
MDGLTHGHDGNISLSFLVKYEKHGMNRILINSTGFGQLKFVCITQEFRAVTMFVLIDM